VDNRVVGRIVVDFVGKVVGIMVDSMEVVFVAGIFGICGVGVGGRILATSG